MKKAADEFPKHLDNFLGDIKHAKQEIRNGRKMADILNDPGMETLKEVLQTGANDVYVVATKEGDEILLPVIPDCVKDLDVGKKVVTVHIMAGLRG